MDPVLVSVTRGDGGVLCQFCLGEGEFAKSYKWFLIAKENGNKLAELQMDNFDWDRKHKSEGAKMAKEFKPKKSTYPYSW